MTTIYKLKDIQKVFNWKTSPGEVLSIQPVEVNYAIEITTTLKICEVYNYFKKSRLPLVDHLRAIKVTDDCYIKFKNSDVEILKLKSV
jgi:hypothetical protein